MAARVRATYQHGSGISRHDIVADDGRRCCVWTVPCLGANKQVIEYQVRITERDQTPADEQLAIGAALQTVE